MTSLRRCASGDSNISEDSLSARQCSHAEIDSVLRPRSTASVVADMNRRRSLTQEYLSAQVTAHHDQSALQCDSASASAAAISKQWRRQTGRRLQHQPSLDIQLLPLPSDSAAAGISGVNTVSKTGLGGLRRSSSAAQMSRIQAPSSIAKRHPPPPHCHAYSEDQSCVINQTDGRQLLQKPCLQPKLASPSSPGYRRSSVGGRASVCLTSPSAVHDVQHGRQLSFTVDMSRRRSFSTFSRKAGARAVVASTAGDAGGHDVLSRTACSTRRVAANSGHSDGYFSADQDQVLLDHTASDNTAHGAHEMSAHVVACHKAPRNVLRVSQVSPNTTKRAAHSQSSAQSARGVRAVRTVGSVRAGLLVNNELLGKTDSDDEVSDTVSEAGTYTIENDTEQHGGDNVAVTEQPPPSHSTTTTTATASDVNSRRDSIEDADERLSSCRSSLHTNVNIAASDDNWIEKWAADVTRLNNNNKVNDKHGYDGCRRSSRGSEIGGTLAAQCDDSAHLALEYHTGDDNTTCGRHSALSSSVRLCSQTTTHCDDLDAGDVGATRDADGATIDYLQATRDAMTSLQARLSDSVGESQRHRKQAQRGSRASSVTAVNNVVSGAGGRDVATSVKTTPACQTAGSELKFNRALSLRRARLGLSDCGATSSTSVGNNSAGSGGKMAPVDGRETRVRRPSTNGRATNSGVIARGDGGRYSLRASSSASHNENVYGRSGSSSSRAVVTRAAAHHRQQKQQQQQHNQELVNWQRRKNYDPLKSARQDKSRRTDSSTACGGGPLRSASFHGTAALMTASLPARADAAASPHLAHADCSVSTQRRVLSRVNSRSSCRLAVDSGKTGGTTVVAATTAAPAAKKALDNLVMGTIHSLSEKLRCNTESLVSKLKCNFDSDDVRYTLLDDILCSLTCQSQCQTGASVNSGSSGGRTASRDLAATLKNLRALEQSVQVLEQVLCEDECELSEVEDNDDDTAALAAVVKRFGDEFF